ncbi:oocyte zinc finger protein XlCOF8.4-like isoform X3 [Pyxicephalus adspersus]|uniref:oocyte zinc finger protein XlCOF8.4-like isoform X3 n=1 Tax=Pyxicephalus adspersus TaxID=30357 RepID=UPI003B5C382F
MEKERRHLTERILNLTLEIIYLLTGENYIAFKLCDGLVAPNLKKTQSSFMVQPPSLSPERNNDKKIEEVTQKMIELLTGEVPTRYKDANEEHDNLCKDDVIENRLPLILSDKSSNRNPPERCPRPLYSQDSTQEDLEIPHHIQGSNIVTIKVEDEDPYVGSGGPCKEEEIPPEINADGLYQQYKMEKCSRASPESQDDDEIPADSPGDPTTTDFHPLPHNADLFDASTRAGSFTDSHPVTFDAAYGTSKNLQCPKCGKCFTQITALLAHKQTHTEERPHSCPECGRQFAMQKHLMEHLVIHTTDQTFSCTFCRKHFLSKSRLERHEIIHTGRKPYSCSVCGKQFTQKANVARHERTHTGEKPFSCSECGKSFTRKATLIEHQYLHR